MSAHFSIIILTKNEEQHLPRLLESLQGLECPLFVLDSGSTDRTLEIARAHGATTLEHPFENHPKQWHYALSHFEIATPWTLGLDADQIVLPELYEKLKNFRDEDIPADVNGIYLNRKNYFKGRWLKHGGYFPKYLLKLFRTGIGYSDLHENMDHRFIVPGRTLLWKDGYLKEENLKENEIGFWIEKHNRYSDLVAQEEVERRLGLRTQTIQPRLFGHPDQRIAWFKRLWWKLPLRLRPYLYFIWRFFFQLGFLDGPEGRLFHYLQAFWFRMIVDVKIGEKMKK
ncbi:MAG: glycosyltransferase family 2 protein [Saprospirales bacterium]|nr:glycosyltransferase family 2 protein [Saprospirales bacterium]